MSQRRIKHRKPVGGDFDGFGVAVETMEDILASDIAPIAVLRLTKEGLALMWAENIFRDMPDEVRALIVHLLRFHADKIETKQWDARMKQMLEPQS